jgi:tryptophanyl-tRNA synthetase
MTKVEINPGACGFLVTILATKVDPKKATVEIQTECEQVNEMAAMITHLTVQDILGFPFGEDIVYQAAKKVIRHAGCPVPCGIIKVTEAELGLAVKRDVIIHFKE